MFRSIRSQLFATIILLTIIQLIVGGVIGWQTFTQQRDEVIETQSDILEGVTNSISTFLVGLEADLRQTLIVQRISTLPSDEQEQILLSLRLFNTAFDELALVDPQGQELAFTSRFRTLDSPLQDRSSDDTFLTAVSNSATAFSAIRFDPFTGEPVITIATPYTNPRTDNLEVVLMATTRLKDALSVIENINLSSGEDVYVIDSSGRVVSHRDLALVLEETVFNPTEEDFQTGLSGDEVVLVRQQIEFGEQALFVVAEKSRNDALSAAINIAYLIGLIALFAIVTAFFLGLIVVRRQIVNPINRLVQVTRAVADGDLAQQTNIQSQNEIGTLSNSVDTMIEQLRASVGGLQQEVAQRARDLQTVFDINEQISTILDVARLRQDIVDLTKERFNLYHAHIYEYNPVAERLDLVTGAGHVGRQMVSEKRTIDFYNQHSIVATSARTRQNQIVNDVTQSPTFLPHPLLPNTKSELAVPLIARGQVLGVLDVQSDNVNHFNDDVVGIIELLGDQISTALSNAALFERTDRTSRHEQALGNITQSIQSANNVEEILQAAVRELGKALRVPQTAIELNLSSTNQDEN